jgi:imidazolonepropionase-like amidohydrolase
LDVMTETRQHRVFYRGKGVFDGVSEGLRLGDGLLVENDRVLAVGPADLLAGPGVKQCDFANGVIVPGFVDAHTHVTIRPGEGDQHAQLLRPAAWQTIRGVENLRRMLRSGVTTARIMTEEHDIDFEYRDAIARGEVCGPRLLVSGPGLSPPGGHGSAAGGVAGVDDLRAAVRERAARGADHIKIFTTGGVSSNNTSLNASNYSPAEIEAIVSEAAAVGLKVSAHAHGGAGVELAVANGIHSIEHGALLDAGNIQAMARSGTWLVLTNSILFHPEGIERGDARVPAIMDKVRQARATMEQNIGRVREASIPLAVGTDSMHGLIGCELHWMVEHGWSVQQALTAATSGGAALIGEDDVGVLRQGARADFVVLRSDPFDDITAVFDVTAVYKDGCHVVSSDGSCHQHVNPYSTPTTKEIP